MPSAHFRIRVSSGAVATPIVTVQLTGKCTSQLGFIVFVNVMKMRPCTYCVLRGEFAGHDFQYGADGYTEAEHRQSSKSQEVQTLCFRQTLLSSRVEAY